MNRLNLFVLAVFVLCPHGGGSSADDAILRWQLTPERFNENRLTPAAGEIPAVTVQPAQFSDGPPALLLDAETQRNQHLVVSDAIETLQLPTDAISVSAWVQIDKPIEWGGVAGVIQDNGAYEKGWLLGYRNSQFCFALSSTDHNRLTYLTDNRPYLSGHWYHIVGTYDGQTQRLYVDGELRVASTEQSGSVDYPTDAVFVLGAYRDNDELHALTGQLEQVSLWDRSLDADEVAQIFADRKDHFPDIEAVRPQVTDWPTYLRDNQRTGLAIEDLPFPLQLQWSHVARHAPAPAWPPPARQDFWHNKSNLNPRVTYDRAMHLVTVGDDVFFASSSDDQVYCLDARTGEIRWTFFAEGPVRLAPTIANGKVLFGADDGRVYCLAVEDGSLQWRFEASDADRRVPGNGRIISDRPVRTGVIVDGDAAFFCAGLFPSQGVEQFSINIQTGELIARGPLDVSPQGYMERRAGRLFLATGRDPAGAFAAQLQRRGKGIGVEINSLSEDYRYAFISAGAARIGGGDGQVAAFSADSGEQIWSAAVEGKAYSVVAARERLLVSTDAGHVYCFSAASVEQPQVIAPGELTEFDSERKLSWIESSVNIEGHGYCLVLSADPAVLHHLAETTEMRIVGLATETDAVDTARRKLSAAGVYGHRVAVHQVSAGAKLPYSDYLFNCVIADTYISDETADRSVWPLAEIQRVVRPSGGLALLDRGDDGRFVRGPLEGVGEWTHQYADPANTTCSQDQLVNGDLRMQWWGLPGPRDMIDRHHRTSAPLFSNGYLFVPGDDRVFAVDGYNGAVLWEREFGQSRRIAVFRDCSQLAAAEDTLYLASAGQCEAIDARTGEVTHKFSIPGDEEDQLEWGYVAVVGDTLFGSGVTLGASRRETSREVAATETFWDYVPLVGSQTVFAYDRITGDLKWSYDAPAGLVVNPTMTISEDRVLFVESANRETFSNGTGRATAQELFSQGASLIALSAESGSIAWQVPVDFRAIQHNLYLAATPGKVIAVGSRNLGDNRETAEVLYDIWAYDAENGEELWNNTQHQGTKIGGDHGEQDHHPVIVGEMLFCEPFAYSLNSGKEIVDLNWHGEHRRGCGNVSASAGAFFFRQSNPTMFDIGSGEYSPVTQVSRPGCWINMIPAGGLLLVPEASSGCTCDYAIQSSFALIPVTATEE